MKGTLVLRLVDITLLLLLSLMAAATIRTDELEIPATQQSEEQGAILLPLEVMINPAGALLIANTPTSVEYIINEALRNDRGVEFLADRDSPVDVLLDAHSTLQARGIEVVFLVEQETAD